MTERRVTYDAQGPINIMDTVRHLTSVHLPVARCTGYDYILAGNGLWKRASNRHIEACLPLHLRTIPGLPPMERRVLLRGGKVPGSLLHTALDDARRRAWGQPREAMYHIAVDGGKARLLYPPQAATAAHIEYRGGDDPAIICDLHSHHELDPRFSGTDDRDELGFRFYAVMAHIFTRPVLALRLGIHGDHWRVPVTNLFSDPGPFAHKQTFVIDRATCGTSA